MRLGVSQQRQMNFEAQYPQKLKCKEIEYRRKADYTVSDWLSHTRHREIIFKGCHDTQPSSTP